MDNDFWHERWKQNEIGFHMDDPHHYLQAFFAQVARPGQKVFVPLCGKTPDLVWLRDQGYEVVGVELSRLAVEAFFAENGIEYKQDDTDGLSRYRSPGITIYCGDLFALGSGELNGVGAVYDRGALVALPRPMRRRYVDYLLGMLPADCRYLVVAYIYNQDEVDGPPFAVPPGELAELFADSHVVDVLRREDALPTHRILQERGLTALTEYAALLKAPAGRD